MVVISTIFHHFPPAVNEGVQALEQVAADMSSRD